MKNSPAFLAVCFVCSCALVSAEPEDTADRAGPEQQDVKFTQTAPYSDATNITRHFGYTVELPAYAITNESFRVFIPRTYSTNGSWGLLVWISPSDDPVIPFDWKQELKNRELLFVSARDAGNGRHPLDRFRLALDATCNLCRRCRVDRKRIYIGGFSGGARMASMMGVAYADVFTGTLCVCGVNFYKDVALAGGKYYPATFVPDPGVLLLSKRSRFVLLTGEYDENRENTKSLSMSGFKREGFRNVLYLEVPGMGHSMPDVQVLRQALDYLAGKAG
jgi:predicted esterase